MAKIKHLCCSLFPGEPVINIFNQIKSSHLTGSVRFGTGYSCAYLHENISIIPISREKKKFQNVISKNF